MGFRRDGSQLRLFQSLASSTKAGLSLLRALEVVRPIAPEAADRLSADVRGGAPLAAAMRRQPEYFPDWQAALVEVGEATGRVDAALANVAGLLEERRAFAMAAAPGLLYPAALLHAAPLFFCGEPLALWFTEGAAATPRVLAGALAVWLKFLAPVYAAGAAAAWAWTGWIRPAPWSRRLPVWGAFVRLRFASHLRGLLAAGVRADRSVALAAAAAGIEDADPSPAGAGLTERLRALGLFEADELAQLEAAELSGAFPEQLGRLADDARARWQAGVAAAASVLPPMLYAGILIVVAVRIINAWSARMNVLDAVLKM